MVLQFDSREKSLSRVAATCKILLLLCKLAFAVLTLWCIAVFVLMCFSLSQMSFDGEMLPLALAVPFLFILYSLNACLIPFVFGKMLNDISENRTPFTFKNSNRLLFLAVVLLMYAVFEALLASVDSQFVLIAGNDSIEVGNFIRDFASNSGTTLNLFPLLMSAMFFALSYVFKYGVLLQQESDETL